MKYGEIFNKAWKSVWKHKIFWLFGLLAAGAVTVTNAPFGVLGFNFSINLQNNRLPGNLNRLPDVLSQWVQSLPGWVWGVGVLVILVLLVLALFLQTLGMGGLIGGGLLAADKTDANRLNFGQIYGKLKPFYWRLLLIRLVVGIGAVLLIVVIALIIAVVGVFTLGIGLLWLIPLLLLVLPINWFLTGFVHNSSIALVDENLEIFPALGRGWQISIDNFWHVIVIGAFLGVVEFFWLIVIQVPMVILVVTQVFQVSAPTGAALMQNNLAGPIIVAGIFVVIATILYGWMNAYTFTVRVLAFRAYKALAQSINTGTAVPNPPMQPVVPTLPPTTQDMETPPTEHSQP